MRAMKKFKIYDGCRLYNMGIQMKRKELTKIFMVNSNQNPFVSMVYTQIYQG